MELSHCSRSALVVFLTAAEPKTRAQAECLGSLFFATCQPDRLNSCRLSLASGDTMKKPNAVSTDCDLDRRTVLKFGAGISASAVASRGPVFAAGLGNNHETARLS